MSWRVPVTSLDPAECVVCRRFVNCTKRSPQGRTSFSTVPLHGTQVRIGPVSTARPQGWGRKKGPGLVVLWGYAAFMPRSCPVLLSDSISVS